MSKSTMTDERVLELIDAFGAEPGGWPEADREAADAHIRANPHVFEAALEQARALDMMLAAEPIPEPSAQLAERILASAPAAESARRRNLLSVLGGVIMPNGRRWPAGAALASLTMGLFAGYAASASTPSSVYQTDAENVVYGAIGYGDFESYIEDEVAG